MLQLQLPDQNLSKLKPHFCKIYWKHLCVTQRQLNASSPLFCLVTKQGVDRSHLLINFVLRLSVYLIMSEFGSVSLFLMNSSFID
jgi:hypothetical protein